MRRGEKKRREERIEKRRRKEEGEKRRFDSLGGV